MDVYLVRHAKSSHDPKYMTDAERTLSRTGRERQILASQGMKTLGFTFDEVWVSPYLRAQQTMNIILSTLKITPLITNTPDLIVFADPTPVQQKLYSEAQQHPKKKILIVGHNPNISHLLWFLTTEKHYDMKTSDLAHIQIIPDSSSALKTKLIAYYPRKQLIELGKQASHAKS